MGVIPRGKPLCPGYRALRLLRRGHAVEVFDAWSEERDCRCIAKAVRRDLVADRETRASLFLEARLLLRLAHPHLVRAYELIRGSRPVLVLETLTGAMLSKLISDHPRGLAARDVLFLGIHLSSALEYLHGAGYLHLDLKPSNVVAQAGSAKLIDLSLAARIGRRALGVGTPGYMAPEQIAGHAVTPGTDVWGLGCVLHEVARGTPAFPVRRGSTQPNRRPEPLQGRSRLPRGAARVIDACLHPDPGARPAVRELSAAFRAAL
jgi:serine/threonine protein kinase